MIKYKFIIAGLFMISSLFSVGQEGVAINKYGNPPDPSAAFDVSSTTKGVLIPRMSTALRLAIIAPVNGLLVFDTDSSCFFFYKSLTSSWISICSGGSGISGVTGPTGPNGIAGIDGTNGAIGPSGNTGPTGVNGLIG